MTKTLQTQHVQTHQVTIWMAGDLVTAHRVIRDYCYAQGACFTITPSKFIYTGGEEDGFQVGLVNYPKFPSTVVELHQRAEGLAQLLLHALNQRTCLLVGVGANSNLTQWIVAEPPGVTSSPRHRRSRSRVEPPSVTPSPVKNDRLCSCQCPCTGICLESECPYAGGKA